MEEVKNEYDGLETSDELLEAIEKIASGRACDVGSPAWNVWQDPNADDFIKIDQYLDTKYPGWREEGFFWGDGETYKGGK